MLRLKFKFLAGLICICSVSDMVVLQLALAAEAADLSGDWVVHSSVGGKTPVTVNCTLVHSGNVLGGECTPVMANAQPSTLVGMVTGSTAQWGYDVVFNNNPGRVDFTASEVSADKIIGELSLSGNLAPFEALKVTE